MKKAVLAMLAIYWMLSCERTPVSMLDGELRRTISETVASGDIHEYLLPSSDDLASIPNQDPKNLLNPAKVALGKLLFFETGIGLTGKNKSLRQTYSCSSCHVPEKGFTAGRFQGIADGGVGFGIFGAGREKSQLYMGDSVDAQGARPLPMHNLAFVTNTLWAGSFGSFAANIGTEGSWHQDTLTEINFQGLFGLEANNIRALQVHRQLMNRTVADTLGYTSLFDAAFPDFPVSERYTLKTAAFAIAAYQRTISTNQAPFQQWLKGDEEAMTNREKKGALLFFGKAGCVSCHQGPALNQMAFFALGVKDLYQPGYEVFRTGPADKRNLGRGGFTGRDEDLYKFKVPQLYNLADIGFYFHGASKQSLAEVVDYFNKGVPENANVPASRISPLLRPLNLSGEEVINLTAFLSGGLHDPNMLRYVPDFTLSGNCFPNNDPQSKNDMDCH